MSARESSLPPTNRKDVPVTTPGGHRIQLRVFPAAQSSSVVIVAGAMGVGQHCYEKFARYLSSQGFTAITFDYFGMGASLNSHLRDCPVKVTEWGVKTAGRLSTSPVSITRGSVFNGLGTASAASCWV